jgi:hypothetical protein
MLKPIYYDYEEEELFWKPEHQRLVAEVATEIFEKNPICWFDRSIRYGIELSELHGYRHHPVLLQESVEQFFNHPKIKAILKRDNSMEERPLLDFEETLKGRILIGIDKIEDREIIFICENGDKYKLYHEQDCSESVYIEDICGDLQDLIGEPLLEVEEAISRENPPDYKPDEYSQESSTWTFYKLATVKGSVTIRFHGQSNGFYSELVDFCKLSKKIREEETNSMTELKIFKERVLAAAKTCSQASEILQALFPEAFTSEWPKDFEKYGAFIWKDIIYMKDHLVTIFPSFLLIQEGITNETMPPQTVKCPPGYTWRRGYSNYFLEENLKEVAKLGISVHNFNLALD